jgi:hypothetical protein
MKRSIKTSMLVGLATVSVVALSACGASSSASPAAGGKPGLTKINVGVIPIVDTAPIGRQRWRMALRIILRSSRRSSVRSPR